MSDLPISWSEVLIGTFARVIGGGTPPSKDPANFALSGQGIPWLTPADLSGYRNQTIGRGARDLTLTGFAACGATLLPKGTVLFSSRAPIGYVAIATNEISTNQGFKSFVLPEGFDSRYCYYQLRHLKPEAEAIATGTTFKELSGAAAATLPFKVAPLNEQIRIADQLDILLAHVNKCNDHLDAIPGILKRFRHAVFDSATTGALTQVWRESSIEYASEKSARPEEARLKGLHELPEGWRWARFSEFVSRIRSGTSAVPSGELSAYPVLRSSSVRPMDIDLDDVRYLPNLSKVRADDLLEDGDLLFTRLSGSLDYVANCAVVRGLGDRKIYYPDRLFRARLTRPEQGSYFELCFSSPLLREHLTVEAKSTAGHQRISMGAVTGFPIPLPPQEEQQEIIRQVKVLFAIADRIEARYTAMRAHALRLAPQLLTKAFRGELVEQDPSDEPASVMLARVAAQRATRAHQPKTRKTSQPRATRAPKEAAAMTKSRHDDDVKGKPYLAGHLRRLGAPATAEALFKEAELPVADFYKQLAWEVNQGFVQDNQTSLESGHAAR